MSWLAFTVMRTVMSRRRKCGLRNIDYTFSDYQTSQDRDSLDIVYLHNTLPMVKDKKTALQEINQILKPGGRLSYMSRGGSRILGNHAISEREVLSYLISELYMILLLEQEGHHIFEKQK